MSTCILLSYLLGDSSRNVIMWLDHRAVSQVHRINETKHSVLQYVGGVMSVEMQAPKLLWLKEVSVWGDGRALTVLGRFLHPLKIVNQECPIKSVFPRQSEEVEPIFLLSSDYSFSYTDVRKALYIASP